VLPNLRKEERVEVSPYFSAQVKHESNNNERCKGGAENPLREILIRFNELVVNHFSLTPIKQFVTEDF
jgi:hypothetical protein